MEDKTMKKSFALLALVPFVLFSCQKEVAQNDIDTVVPTLDNGIPTIITCDINQEATTTRTQYADNQTFGWTNGDQVKMVAKNDSGWNFFTFETSDESGKASAVFGLLDSYNPPASPVSGTWTNTGYIIYPSSIFIPEGGTQASGWNSGNYPVVDLPSSYPYSATAPLNSASGVTVPLIGRKVGGTYWFSTAVGFIKVTINSMPGATKKVVLESANNSIAGKFAVSLVPENENVAQILNTSATAGTSSITLNVSSVDAGSDYDFYFPLPVGTYAANDLTIKVLDSKGDVLVSKTVGKVLTIARNEILELPVITRPYYSVSVSGTATAPAATFVKKKSVFFVTVSDSEETLSRDSYISGQKFSYEGTSTYSSPGFVNSAFMSSTSGKKYLHYTVAPYRYGASGITCAQVDEADIIEQGCVPFYFLSAEDESRYTGTYTTDIAFEHPGTGSNYNNELVLAVSSSVSDGQLMLTDIFGHPTLGGVSINKPICGIISGNTLTFAYNGDTYENRFFTKNNNNFHVVQNGNDAAVGATQDIVFSISEANSILSLTNSKYIMIKYQTSNTYTDNGWSKFIYGQNLVFSKNL